MFDKFIREVIWNWGVRCFGAAHMHDKKVRAVRFVEEAVELAQALDVPEAQIQAVVINVYRRDRGTWVQEVGGSLVTLLALCDSLGVDPKACLETEVHRCLSKDPAHFTRRNQQKLDAGLTG